MGDPKQRRDLLLYWEHYTRPGGPVWGTTLGGQCGGPLNFNQAGGPRFGNFGPWTPHHWLGGPASEILARGPLWGAPPLGGPASEILARGPLTPGLWGAPLRKQFFFRLKKRKKN